MSALLVSVYGGAVDSSGGVIVVEVWRSFDSVRVGREFVSSYLDRPSLRCSCRELISLVLLLRVTMAVAVDFGEHTRRSSGLDGRFVGRGWPAWRDAG